MTIALFVIIPVFVFVDTFKKAVTNPTTTFCSRNKPMFGVRKFLRNWQRVSFLMKIFSNQSFWCVCKTFWCDINQL